MTKKMLLSACLLACSAITHAQDDTTKHRKIFDHHIGVQMNELIRQVFNFNNANANTPVNPYFITYNINFARSGWGLRLGAGYTHRSFGTNDGITRNTTDVNAVNARFGIEKAFRLGHRWSAGIGADAVYKGDYSKTNTVTKAVDSITTTVTTDVATKGGGAMGWLRYNVTPNIVIGTEISFYYQGGQQKQTVAINQRNNSLSNRPYQTTTTKIDNKTEDGSFILPVVFYLMVRF